MSPYWFACWQYAQQLSYLNVKWCRSSGSWNPISWKLGLWGRVPCIWWRGLQVGQATLQRANGSGKKLHNPESQKLCTDGGMVMIAICFRVRGFVIKVLIGPHSCLYSMWSGAWVSLCLLLGQWDAKGMYILVLLYYSRNWGGQWETVYPKR